MHTSMRTPSHLPPDIAARERSYRRRAWMSVGSLTLLGVGAIVAHHLLPPEAHQNLWAALHPVPSISSSHDQWQFVLRATLVIVHHGFHILLVTGFLYAVWDRLHAWRGLAAALAHLETRRPRPGSRLWRAAHVAALDPTRVRVARWLPDPAFTVGWIRPVVYVAQPLIRRLGRDELASLLAHERAHVIRRDPLRLAILRGIACGLFWIPVLRQLVRDVADDMEVCADDDAVVRVGDRPATLATAILHAARWPQSHTATWNGTTAWQYQGAVGFTAASTAQRAADAIGLLERRVRRLMGENPPIQTHVTPLATLTATATLVLGWLSSLAMTH